VRMTEDWVRRGEGSRPDWTSSGEAEHSNQLLNQAETYQLKGLNTYEIGSQREQQDSRLSLKLTFELVHEPANPIEPHALALLVEIKVDVLCPRLVDDEHGVLKRFLNRTLVLDLIDEVDEGDVAVSFDLVLEVGLEGGGLQEPSGKEEGALWMIFRSGKIGLER
jgi:hypothetical protein